MVELSLEEVTFAVASEARPEVRSDIVALMRQSGLSRSAVVSSMRAAQHSLLARGLLDLETRSLNESVEQVARAMLDARFSIGYRRSDLTTFYYFGSNGTLQQKVEHGLVHSFGEVDGPDAVLDSGLAFFEIPEAVVEAEFDVPAAVFEAVREASDPDLAERQLADAGAPDPLRSELVEDLFASKVRGDVIRHTYDEQGRPRPDAAMLVLSGNERSWLIRLSGESNATIVRCGADVFRRETARLLTRTK
jgi:hypothetical protein